MIKKIISNVAEFEKLKSAIETAKEILAIAEKALYDFSIKAENNVYASIKDALSDIEIDLLDQAKADCEGAYNFGNDEYTQLFMVDSMTYLATLTVEYNRYDKKYYYIDVSEFSYEAV